MLKACIVIGLWLVQVSGFVFDPFHVFCGFKNCYDILQVPPDASISIIRKAVRKRNWEIGFFSMPDDPKIDYQKVRKVSERIWRAYAILRDHREVYDDFLSHPYPISGYVKCILRFVPSAKDMFLAKSAVILSVAIATCYWLYNDRYNRRTTHAS